MAARPQQGDETYAIFPESCNAVWATFPAELLDGIGRFGWAVDPEGNRFELWELLAR